MLGRIAVVLLAVPVWSLPAVAGADPVVPRPGAPCLSRLVDAMTWPPGDATPLLCAADAQRWEAVARPYPVSDRWVSYGPAVELHGQGRRNPSMLSGAWMATPTSPASRCHAEQVAVVPGTPTIGPPRIDDGEPGRPLSIQVVPTMSSIDISGECLWQKVAPEGFRSGW